MAWIEAVQKPKIPRDNLVCAFMDGKDTDASGDRNRSNSNDVIDESHFYAQSRLRVYEMDDERDVDAGILERHPKVDERCMMTKTSPSLDGTRAGLCFNRQAAEMIEVPFTPNDSHTAL